MYSDPLYLDYASSTPIDPEVQQAMIDTMAKTFANPSAVHSDGVSSARIISEARQQIATLIEVKPQEIIFTGSGTESINLAFKGLIEVSQIANPHIITSSIEHSATQETCRYLEKKGVEVTYISPDENGLIDPDLINQNIKPGTVLVSIMYVNNELGTIQPLRQISHQITEHNHHRDQPVVFHTDASQAPIFLPISVQSIGVDMLTLDGSKIYGPRGIGVLVKKNYVSLEPIIHGGGQEFNLRSGTENTPAIVGMSLALKKAVTERHQITVKLTKLKERLRQGLLQSIKNISENTPPETAVPGIFNFCVPGLEAEFYLMKLDQAGLECSSTSSCQNSKTKSGSYVIENIGKEDCSRSSIRLSLGKFTTEQDIDRAIEIIKKVFA